MASDESSGVGVGGQARVERSDVAEYDAKEITRPDKSLMTYYLIISLCSTVAFPFVFIPLMIRYKTLRYRFDEAGVSMCWGYFFRREIYLTYRRLQDIHVTRNIVERWMDLAKVSIQTASGTSGATMKIEGIRDPEPLRDFLYAHMRGAREETGPSQDESEATAVLLEIRDALRGWRPSPGAES